MKKPPAFVVLLLGAGVASVALAAQGEWTTGGFDAQRTAWVRSDGRMTPSSVEDGTFTFLWRMALENTSRGPSALTPPVLLDRLIGYRGFKTLAFVGGSSDRVFAVDADLARPYWMTQLNYTAATGGPPPVSPGCPGGLTATPSRRTPPLVPTAGGGRGGRGARSMSAVGEPGRGAAILSQAPRGRGAAPARGRGPASATTSARARGPVPSVPFGGVDPIYVVGHDGFLRVLRSSNGSESEPAVPFLPPGAMASALVFVEGVVYTTTSKACAATPNAVWAIDLTTPGRTVSSWPTGGPDIIGDAGLAIGGDGTLFVALGAAPGAGPARFANAVVALDPWTLEPIHWFSSPGVGFSSSPMVVRHQDRDLVAVAGDDGRLYVLDGRDLGGADRRTALHVTAPYGDGSAGGSLATWEDQGRRWVLAPAGGAPPTGATFRANGAAPDGSIVAFELRDQAGQVTLEPAWASRNVPAALGPIVVNGVVFAAASGEWRGGPANLTAAERARRSGRATLYALDGLTGREMWNSGTTIRSFARSGLAAGGGQVYLVTGDSHLYAFGIPMEH